MHNVIAEFFIIIQIKLLFFYELKKKKLLNRNHLINLLEIYKAIKKNPCNLVVISMIIIEF